MDGGKVFFISTLIAGAVVGGMAYDDWKRERDLDEEMELRCMDYWEALDSIARVNPLRYDSLLEAENRAGAARDSSQAQNDIKGGAGAYSAGLAGDPSTNARDDNNAKGAPLHRRGGGEVEETESQHPGTPPDDPMFGFDYWDDVDDAYEMDRNQQDAYPDEW